jgi:hypothetical protein
VNRKAPSAPVVTDFETGPWIETAAPAIGPRWLEMTPTMAGPLEAPGAELGAGEASWAPSGVARATVEADKTNAKQMRSKLNITGK